MKRPKSVPVLMTERDARNVKPMTNPQASKSNLLTIAKLKPGETHFVPGVNSIPFRDKARCEFKIGRAKDRFGLHTGVIVERVA